jgi:hypothetical protein
MMGVIKCTIEMVYVYKSKCSGPGTGCTQPREYKLRSYLIEK